VPGWWGMGCGGVWAWGGGPVGKTGRGSRRRDVARRHFHPFGRTALRLVLRLAGTILVLLSRRRRDLSHLRRKLALLRALAADPVGKPADLRALRSHSRNGICAASPTQGRGAPCRCSPRLSSRSIPGAISRASTSGATSTRRGGRSASISSPRPAATPAPPPAPPPPGNSSRPPT